MVIRKNIDLNSIKYKDFSKKQQLFFDESLVQGAIEKCKLTNKKNLKRSYKNAARLLRVEKKVGIPFLMYGMTLAAACLESAYNEKAKGDHKFSKKRKPLAIGILQLWPWTKKHGVDRMNLESSAEFWLRHVVQQKSKVKKRCKSRINLRLWRQAWVTAVRAPKKGGRCRETPNHWKLFLRLQKVKKNIIIQLEEASVGNQATNKEK
jgi:hypothetical protein